MIAVLRVLEQHECDSCGAAPNCVAAIKIDQQQTSKDSNKFYLCPVCAAVLLRQLYNNS